MTRDEAVQKLATAGRLSIAHAEDLYDSFFPKPVVPQYVADWYEEYKERFDFYLSEFLCDWYGEDHNDNSPFSVWFGENRDAIQTLVNMHQFGYEVKEETKYKVRIKGVSESKNYLNLDVDNKWYFLASEYEVKGFETKFTRQQLEEAGFGEVFDNPMFEIEEVE